jgi:uncharacterized protein (TIGR01244 family)
MNKLRSGLLLVVLSLAACRTVVVEGAPAAPHVPAPGFVSIGPADAPARLADCGNTDARTECRGPLVAISAQPSESDFAAAKAAGYRTVVNFRVPGEEGFVDERAFVEAQGLRYVEIPVKGTEVGSAQAASLDAVLSDPAAGPALLHCRKGVRATMVWTVWLGRHGGLTPEAALVYGERAGLSGEALAAAEKALR